MTNTLFFGHDDDLMKVGRDENEDDEDDDKDDDKDDLSRFNSSSEENDDDGEDDEEEAAERCKRGDHDASGTPSDIVGNTKRKRLNAAERKRLKKKETQHIKAERRKRERERLEKANKEGEEEEEEEEKTAKTKKKKKKKKKANATDGDGGDVIETDEETDETKTRNTKKYHHTFEVEGVIIQDGTLVLVDKRSLAVYSSEEREGNGEHKRIGTWDAATKTVKRNDSVDIANNGSSTSSSSGSSSDEDEDDDDDTKSPSSDDSEDETKQQHQQQQHQQRQQQTEPIKLDINHAFECNLDDHCETSLEAHKDIVNFLNIAASQKSKKPSELVIYDPYYCAGATKMNFAELGFPNVINENKDFYELVAKNEVPKHDVFVTNPPYSEEHVEKCVTFAAKNMTEFGRPYFMLVPSYVVCKPYFVPALLTGGTRGAEERENKEDTTKDEMNMHKKRGQVLPFYIAPTKRYYYFTPKPLAKLRNKNIAENGIEKKRRGHVGRRGERTSPFLSLWICGFGEDQVEALRLHKKLRREQVKHYVVARNPKEIPLNVLDEWDPRRRTESGAHDKMKNKKK